MKKTLAAVLAAMMALSTSAVALAKDTDVVGSTETNNLGDAITVSSSDNEDVVYGETAKFALQAKETVDGVEKTYLDVLGRALAMKKVKIDATVTDGRSLLASAPTVKAHEIKLADGTVDGYRAVLYVKVKDTFSTDADKGSGDADIAMRVRVTALEGFTLDNLTMAKGDTLSIDELTFNAYYNEILAYGKDMTVTGDEVDAENVVVDASDLISELEERETETATFYFGDVMAFTAKISEAQKDVNVHYSTTVDDDLYDLYPEFSFEAIQFQATPKFLRKGTLTFNAIGGADTVVYEDLGDGEYKLMEIADYDATYETVTVEGINQLTAYLVASEALEEEAEAEAETEAPEVEDENPNTGAC